MVMSPPVRPLPPQCGQAVERAPQHDLHFLGAKNDAAARGTALRPEGDRPAQAEAAEQASKARASGKGIFARCPMRGAAHCFRARV